MNRERLYERMNEVVNESASTKNYGTYMKQAGYRKDIDGLRCLAVLLVFFYHLGFKYVRAGFVGVDVFFVISGFLITQHIVSDLCLGMFSLKNFYIRRMRRILPALIVVVGVTSIAAYFILLPEPLASYSASALATLLSVSNLYFYKFIQIGYFATDASILPLLHTWSLGIEEQFYIFWPLLLLVIFRFYANRGVFILSVLVCVVSFSLYYLFRFQATADYYLPVTRVFELLIGAILAIIWERILHFSYDKGIDSLLSICGITLILYSGCFLSVEDYPGAYALLPCVGATILIYTGRDLNRIAIGNKILSYKPFVWIGLISYSLYLWHWPVIAFLHSLNIDIGWKLGISIFLISILLAALTWRFVEIPCRFNFEFAFPKTIVLYFSIPILLAVSFKMLLGLYPFIGFNSIAPDTYRIANNFNGPLDNEKCFNTQGALLPLERACSIGDLNVQKNDVLIVGDSHAMASAGMLAIWLKNSKLKGYLMTQNAAPFLLGNTSKWSGNKKIERSEMIKEDILRNHYKYVVMAASWSSYSNAVLNGYFDWSKGWMGGTLDELFGLIGNANNNYSIFALALKNATELILKSGATPIIILDYPPLLTVSTYCGFTNLSHTPSLCYNNKEKIFSMQNQSRNIILNLKKQYPKLVLVDPGLLICDSSKCFSSINGIPLYYDNGKNSHLNYNGSVLIGKLFLEKYKNPFVMGA